MGSGQRKRAELARLGAELSAVIAEQRAARVWSDPRWRWAVWALLAWSVVGPATGFALGWILG